MNKTQLIAKLERAWEDLLAAYAGLTKEQMLEPGVTGDWSVRDLIAHVSWWEEEALKHLPEILRGIRPARYSVTYGGIDAFNAQMTELRRDLSLDEVLHLRDETHARLLAYLHAAPEEQLASDTRFRRRLRLDTYGHYPIHAQAMRDWRARRQR